MQKSEVRVLIVEDDSTVGTSLTEAFSRAGYKATHVSRPTDALSQVKLQSINAVLIDCMLPQMNGRELAQKIRKEAPETSIYLMSGVYKDKSFAREAMQESGALGFFTKPFDLPNVIKQVESGLGVAEDLPKAPFHDVLSRPQLSMKERLFAINNSDTMHGLDLPWVYSLLMHPRITGNLNIVTADGEVIGVGFQRGNIVQVVLTDTHSYFGVLLVERGFISSADLELAMQSAGTRAKRMGDRLVDMNLLSPHSIEIVVADQQGIRLSKTIANTSVKTNFTEAEDLREDAQLDRHAYNELLHEWVSSKFPLDWLKAYYTPWMRWNFVKAQEWSDAHRIFNLPLIASKPDLPKALVSGQTLEHLLSENDADESAFFRRLHLLVTSRMIAFGEPARTATDSTVARKRLQKLNEDFDRQTHFERLGVSPKAKQSEIKRAYHELAKVLHPDKLDPNVSKDLRELTRSAFAKISEAYETLNDEQKKSTYIRILEQGNAEKVLEAESLAESGKAFLAKGDALRALDIFLKATELAPPSVDLRLHTIWAKFKAPGKERDPDTIAFVKAQLSTVPPEDRHSALYIFAKGLLLRSTDDVEGARKCFENAATIDSDFIPAKRELNLIKLHAQNAKNSDLLRGDLRDVVGGLFKKKK